MFSDASAAAIELLRTVEARSANNWLSELEDDVDSEASELTLDTAPSEASAVSADNVSEAIVVALSLWLVADSEFSAVSDSEAVVAICVSVLSEVAWVVLASVVVDVSVAFVLTDSVSLLVSEVFWLFVEVFSSLVVTVEAALVEVEGIVCLSCVANNVELSTSCVVVSVVFVESALTLGANRAIPPSKPVTLVIPANNHCLPALNIL